METNSKSSQKFLVLGVTNSGSGTLTFPEDFSIDSVHDDPKSAYLRAIKRNKDNEVPFSVLDEMDFFGQMEHYTGEPTDDLEGDYNDLFGDSEDEYEGEVFDVYPVDHNKK